MRLGVLAAALAVGLVVPTTPAQATPPATGAAASAESVVTTAIDGFTARIVSMRQALDGDERTAVVASLRRDQADLRAVRADLRDGATRTERKAARRLARTATLCGEVKTWYAVVQVAKLRHGLAENARLAEYVRATSGPDLPAEVLDLLTTGAEHRGEAESHLDPLVLAVAPARCSHRDPDFTGAVAEERAALDALTLAWQAVQAARAAADVGDTP